MSVPGEPNGGSPFLCPAPDSQTEGCPFLCPGPEGDPEVCPFLSPGLELETDGFVADGTERAGLINFQKFVKPRIHEAQTL